MTAARPARPPADRGAALVTGATSGIGRALAVELARRGNDVLVVADRDVEPTVHDLSAHGGAHEGLTVDLATPPRGRGDRPARASSASRPSSSTGKILVTSSVAGEMPAPHFAAYAASKAFLRSFAWSLRGELAGTGVTVTALLPGPTRTPFFREAGMERTHVGRLPKPRPAAVARRAVDALLHGRPEVVTGVQGGVMLAAARVLSQPARAAFHGWFYAPVPASLAVERPSSSPLR
ncbi:SDR family NAD(P)-dependent oxidoreductase [Cellulosimicrobium sp. E-16]|uniref:SDR family NAD(P)-dependent oxidoreductase n=1 Tax=Cellulosimicrobium sp. E-16 TaxID=3404049 RepID=UPI003CEC2EC1